MPSHLCFSVLFLDSRFHGRADSNQPEWPPSPLRLFQALVAAAAAQANERQRLQSAVPALRWLAGLPPPLIVAPPAERAAHFCLSVPNNAMDLVARAWTRGVLFGKGDANPATHRTMKMVRPTRFPDNSTLYYLWQLPDPWSEEHRPHAEKLISTARSIVALGWGIDLVAAHAQLLAQEQLSGLLQTGEVWQPFEAPASLSLRVPSSETLDALISRHDGFLKRLQTGTFTPVPPLTAYRLVFYRRTSDPPPRPFAPFRLRHPIEDRAAVFSVTKANHVAAMTRHLVAQIAEPQGKSNDWIDRYVHGHRQPADDTEPRFSYLPLPSLERRGERGCYLGAIRRVLVAELVDSAESHLPWLRKALPGQFLTDQQTQQPIAMLTALTLNDWVLRQYTDPADAWATVTPVVLPGSDDGKFAKAEKLFFKALRHAGYAPEALAELEFRNVCFWPGGPLALRFVLPTYLRNNHWSVYHVRVRWRHAIPGPIALGAGRHCGLGIFARWGTA
jgi:CRISPR-associated protein Csb2